MCRLRNEDGEGEKMNPSVTEILSPYADFSRVPPEVLEAACARGTAVHSFCAAYARGIWAEKPPEIAGYCDSFRAWFDRYVIEALSIEEEFVNLEWGYIGHPDLIVKLGGVDIGLVFAVIDNKTPITHLRIWECQLAAYFKAALKRFPELKRAGSLQLSRDGSLPKMKWVRDINGAFNAFAGLLTGWRYIKGDNE